MVKPGSKTDQVKVSKSKKPYGDFYGTGKRNPIGKVRDVTVGVIPGNKKQLKTPPKKLA